MGGRRLAALSTGLAAALLSGAALAATSPKPVVVREEQPDAIEDAPDVLRAQLGRGSDGRLRAAVSFVDDLTPAQLRATKDGRTPGSVCLRMWTLTTPYGVPPDFLLCVTSPDGKTLTGSIVAEQVNALPRRVVMGLRVTRPSKRSLAVRFTQSSIGRPATVRWAADATRRDCPRTSCTDTLPDAPAVATLRLRSASR